MRKLPYDVSRCTGLTKDGVCEKRDECLRYVDKAEGSFVFSRITDIKIPENGKCGYHIPLTEC